MQHKFHSNNFKYDFNDVMIVPTWTSLDSRADANVTRDFWMPHAQKIIHCCPLIAANMSSVGTVAMANVMTENNCLTALHKYITPQEVNDSLTIRDNVFLTFGMEDIDIIKQKVKDCNYTDDNNLMICLDAANGGMSKFNKQIYDVRKAFPNAVIMAGNIVTPDLVKTSIEAGADIVKVGIGSGSHCETRKVTGIGYPQLSALLECVEAANEQRGYLCSDGGCKTSGDVVKAFAAGAGFVMLGGMLAGHRESITNEEMDELLTYTDKECGVGNGVNLDEPYPFDVDVYGMSSNHALNKYHNGKKDYRASEGKLTKVPYRGTVAKTIKEIQGGIRSGLSYTNSRNLIEFYTNSKFVITGNI
jgi:GMP reductase